MGEEEEAVFPGDMAEENHHPSLKRHRRRLCIEEVYSNKKQTSSNDDINSEISNPVDIITSHAAATSSSGGGRVGSCSGSDSETTSGGGGVTSSFVLEIPKHLSTTGITRITFKLSKPPKEEEEAALCHLPMTTTQERASSNVVSRKKVSDFVSDVKKLLLTGIINGARVKYISNSPLVSFLFFVCVIWVWNILILLRLFCVLIIGFNGGH